MARKSKLKLWIAALGMVALSCSYLLGTTPAPETPFVAPTGDSTGTAAALETQAAEASPTLEITLAPSLEPSITLTLPPAFTPTSGYLPPPNNPTTTPDPDGGPLQRTGASVSALYVSPPPKIDGDVEDWAGLVYTAAEVVFGPEYYSGVSDVSAEFKIGWDTSYLYVGAVVTDNKFIQSSTGAFLYQGDSLEILLDVNVSGDYNSDELNADDYQLGLSPGKLSSDFPPEAYLWFPLAQEGVPSGVKIAVSPREKGYVLEAAIPWSVFGAQPAVGQHFGFAFSISDNDGGGLRQQQTMVSYVTTRLLEDPTSWGDLVLALTP